MLQLIFQSSQFLQAEMYTLPRKLDATGTHRMSCHFFNPEESSVQISIYMSAVYLHYMTCKEPIENHVIDVSSGQI